MSDVKSSPPNRVRESVVDYGSDVVPSYQLVVAERGRVVLPLALRKRLNIQTGDVLTLTVEENGTLVMHTPRTAVAKLRGAFSHLSPGRRAVEELIADRRREAAAEARELPTAAPTKARRGRSR